MEEEKEKKTTIIHLRQAGYQVWYSTTSKAHVSNTIYIWFLCVKSVKGFRCLLCGINLANLYPVIVGQAIFIAAPPLSFRRRPRLARHGRYSREIYYVSGWTKEKEEEDVMMILNDSTNWGKRGGGATKRALSPDWTELFGKNMVLLSTQSSH